MRKPDFLLHMGKQRSRSVAVLVTIKAVLICVFVVHYRKVPKFSDARKLCCNLSKIPTKRPKLIGYFIKMMRME